MTHISTRSVLAISIIALLHTACPDSSEDNNTPDPVDCIESVDLCNPETPGEIINFNECTMTVSVVSMCEESEVCNDRDTRGQLIAPTCEASDTCDDDPIEQCNPDTPGEIISVDPCTMEVTVMGACDMGQTCEDRDPLNRPKTPTCRDPGPCLKTGTDRICNPDDAGQIIRVDKCEGAFVEVAEDCDSDEICTTLDPNTPGRTIPARCVDNSCAEPRETVSQCDTLNARRGVTIDTCTGTKTVDFTCDIDEICSVLDPDNPNTLVAPRCVQPQCDPPISRAICDVNNPKQILSEDSCTGEQALLSTCSGEFEFCTTRDSDDNEIEPTCAENCGDPEFKLVCDANEPGKTFYQDECGNITGSARTCTSPSVCELDADDNASCSCEPLPETDCRYTQVTDPYSPSFVTQENTCGQTVTVDTCDFGERCYQHPDYNGGVAECTRSIDPVQSASPHYDYGCFTLGEHVRFKTSLAIDCRCRSIGSGSMGAGYAEPSTMMKPGNALPNCRNVSEVKNLTWDTPAGFGPKFSAYSQTTINDLWFGSWLDAANRDFYAHVSWTNSDHRRSGTIVSFDLDTGERKVISGLYPSNMGMVTYGSGYESPNSVTAGPATQPLTGVSAMKIGPDTKLYTLGIGTTGEGSNRSAEIVRVDPTTGERTLVWQSQTDERGVNSSPYGQCLSHGYGNTNNVDSYESVAITSRSFAVGAAGEFYMTFNNGRDGDGVIKVSADGSTCTFVSRWGAQDFRLTPQTPLVPAPADIGSGFTPQYGRMSGSMIRDGKLYVATQRLTLMTIDLTTGDRVAVSRDTDGFGGLGRTSIFYDDTRNLIFTAGGPSARDGAVIDETTGRREELFADTSIPGQPLLESVYGVRRSVSSSPATTLAQANSLNYGPLAMDPDDNDILWLVLKGGGLLKLELSTFNNYFFSL